jgi:hypothetical protein
MTPSRSPLNRYRRTARNVAVAALSLTLVSAVPASAKTDHPVNEPATATSVTAAAAMHQLDFLLGTMSCDFSTGSKLRTTTRPVLGGSFYQINMTQKRNGQTVLHGRWFIGWSPSASGFVSYYFDDVDNHGSSTSPGWQDGHLVFVGTYTFGAHGTTGVRDDFTVDGNDHFMIDESVGGPGAWSPLDTQDCHRARN